MLKYACVPALLAMVVAVARLRAAGVPDPARDARVLLAHAAQVDAARVTLIAPEDIAPEIAERYDQPVPGPGRGHADAADVPTRQVRFLSQSDSGATRSWSVRSILIGVTETAPFSIA